MTMRKLFTLLSFCSLAAAFAAAQISVPNHPVAGQGLTVKTSGKGTLLVFGPGAALRKDVKSGEEVTFSADEISKSGHYVAVFSGSGADQTAAFDVAPGVVKKISFLARPSRVPVAKPDVISGTAFVF